MDTNLGLYQQQTISTHMVQSMHVLQMSATELEEYLVKMSMENPVIELADKEPEPPSTDMELQRKLEWLESTDRQNRIYYSSDHEESDYANTLKDPRSSEEDLTEYLWSQIQLHDYSDKEFYIAGFLIRSLDDRGYFTEDMAEIAALLNTTTTEVERLLLDIQKLDPAGIGARDLSECLCLQLDRKQEVRNLTYTLAKSYLSEISKNHLREISKELDADIEDVVASVEEIRSLHPKPGSFFSDRTNLPYISPDVLVVKLEDRFEVLVNEYQYPKFSISSYYQHLEKTTDDPEAKQYLHDKIQEAKNISSGIAQRSHNLSMIATEIVRMQDAFFRLGPGHKNPMKLKDIAEAVQMHESTISRTLKSKYLQCAYGVYPMNYFLTSVASASEETGAEHTPEFIQQKIKEIIDDENKKKPLSDEAIRIKLRILTGVEISRRTVNKYRQEIGIPDKIGRRQFTT